MGHVCNGPHMHERVISWADAEAALGDTFEPLHRLGRIIPTGRPDGSTGFVAGPDGAPVVYTLTRTIRWQLALRSRDADTLLQITRDHDCFVRSELTRNENAPDAVLRALLGDVHPGVADWAEAALNDRAAHPGHAVRA